ncbi:DUF3592 domain-containing protein [Thermospira aquatica]|uniref:DUF3592 domain-containing protein n=1 Tax=Thermospira aquatica TaxID=2828656 RepID=A0AAX3BDH8_9SPIR|nr:DUF3592 domain-containing protein [Thermospira aquatica]URA10322.1 DUF3592 domain-containing protein [Thermospira aquatica]
MEDKKKREKKWLIFIIGIGALLIVLGLNTLFKAFSTYFWSSTQGKILVSQVGFVDRFKRENDSFYFDISYEYSVDGKLYTNSKVFLGQYGSSISNWIQKVVDRYPVGKEVSVYYNPKTRKKQF